jgi:hypothetical protein
MAFPKIVDQNRHYHLWTDVLHGRALAKQAKNRWDRGTYVRWTVMTAWTVLEMACEDALETPEIGRSFKKKLDAACIAKSVCKINWGSGLWQDVIQLHKDRNDFVHINATQEKLFPDSAMTDRTVSTVRDAISDIFHRAGKSPPGWLEDNDDKGWDCGPGSMAHGGVIGAGVDPKGDETVRVSYEYKDREYDDGFYPAGTDHEPLVERLLRNVRIPITAVRVYRGKSMIYERRLQMRGA